MKIIESKHYWNFLSRFQIIIIIIIIKYPYGQTLLINIKLYWIYNIYTFLPLQVHELLLNIVLKYFLKYCY